MTDDERLKDIRARVKGSWYTVDAGHADACWLLVLVGSLQAESKAARERALLTPEDIKVLIEALDDSAHDCDAAMRPSGAVSYLEDEGNRKAYIKDLTDRKMGFVRMKAKLISAP